MHFLANRPGSQVLILCENGNGGFETLQTNASFVWGFGMLDMAKAVLVNRLSELRSPEMEEKVRQKAQSEIEDVVGRKGKLN